MTYWSIDLVDVLIDQAVQGNKKKKNPVSVRLSGLYYSSVDRVHPTSSRQQLHSRRHLLLVALSETRTVQLDHQLLVLKGKDHVDRFHFFWTELIHIRGTE